MIIHTVKLVQYAEVVDEYEERGLRLGAHLDAPVYDDVEDWKEPQVDVAEVGGKVERFRHRLHFCLLFVFNEILSKFE